MRVSCASLPRFVRIGICAVLRSRTFDGSCSFITQGVDFKKCVFLIIISLPHLETNLATMVLFCYFLVANSVCYVEVYIP